MSLFNYIDTFFFISLGITFVLILLLVFHFKSLILNLEKKNDTMFEIINNIVKEINYMKSISPPFVPLNPSQPSFPYGTDEVNEIFGLNEMNGVTTLSDLFSGIHTISNIGDIKPITMHLNKPHPDFEELDDNMNPNDDDSESEEESESDDDSEEGDSELDSEEDSDVEDEEENQPKIKIIKEVEIEPSIKIVNIDVNVNKHETIDIAETIEQPLLSTSVEYPSVNKITIPDDFEVSESIHVVDETIDSSSQLVDGTDVADASADASADTRNIDYNNMTVTELKALVASKHLANNPSKLKKHELIQLLHAKNNL